MQIQLSFSNESLFEVYLSQSLHDKINNIQTPESKNLKCVDPYCLTTQQIKLARLKNRLLKRRT